VVRAGTLDAGRVCWAGREGAGAGRAGAERPPPPRLLCGGQLALDGREREGEGGTGIVCDGLMGMGMERGAVVSTVVKGNV
jgi:hypothetical protein